MPKSSSLKRPKNSSDSDSIYKDEFERLQRQNDQLRQALKEKEYEVKVGCQQINFDKMTKVKTKGHCELT